jgi:glycosyltransferase involved in cell wall biosynthesis
MAIKVVVRALWHLLTDGHRMRPWRKAVRRTGVRVVLLDPSLSTEAGHPARFARLLRAETAHRGWACEIVGAKDLDPTLAAELGASRHFVTNPYWNACADPICGDLEGFIQSNALFARELSPLPISDWSENDFVVLPTVTWLQLYGLALWLNQTGIHQLATTAPLLMFPPNWSNIATQSGIDLQFYRLGLKTMERRPRDKLVLHAETSQMAAVYQNIAGRKVRHIPWPVLPGTERLRTNDIFCNEPVTVAFLGHARAETGVKILPEIIGRIAETRPKTRFRVQLNTDLNGDIATILDELRSVEADLTVLEGALGQAEFDAELDRTDILLLPYNAESYKMRGSGLFAEAIVRGRAIVVPGATWMAEEARRIGAAVVAASGTSAADFARAALELIEAGKTLVAPSCEAAKAWASDRTIAMYLDRLLAARDEDRFGQS